MSERQLVQTIARAVTEATGEAFRPDQVTPAAGGDINQALVVGQGERQYFVKFNRADRLPMFEAEMEGLAALAACGAVAVPQPVCTGSDSARAFLVLQYVALRPADGDAMARLGKQLAVMHTCRDTRFGWHRDNTIGTTPQPNARSDDWVAFYAEKRLRHQLVLAAANGFGGKLQEAGERLCTDLGDFFRHYRPEPSLLHGDLWAGNAAMDATGQPWIYDPAVYYGDRETDLAMTELFGGFPPAFYDAYQATWPVDDGYRVRRELYQLYHILNHLNLFGAGWANRAEQMIRRLLTLS